MKITIINGSPKRDGTSSAVAFDFLERFENQGHVVKKYHLNALEIKGCQECFSCRKKKADVCAVNDGISEILEEVKNTDVMVMSTPVFYGDISAQLKCFIDRTWSYFGKTGISAGHLPKGRTLVFILSYGFADSTIYDQLFEKYKFYLNMFGFDTCYLIKAYGVQYNAPEIINKKDVLSQINEISNKIINAY